MSPQDDRSHRKYGVPIYGASWLPSKVISNPPPPQLDAPDEDGAASAESPPLSLDSTHYMVLSGGGGEGRTGIRNALLLAHFNSASNSLSDHPVARLETGDELPYRLAVHPGGEGLICSMPNACRWYEWDLVMNGDDRKVGVKSSEKGLPQLEGVGQQLAMAFNKDGSILALGDENGYLRVFKWPSMENIIDEPKAHSSVKDLDFSTSGSLLVSSGGGGPCRVWDLTSSTVIASLSKQSDEVFGLCRFSTSSEKNLLLYTTVKHGKGGSIITWDTKSWKRMGSKHIVREPISALSVSPDGSLLAVGTAEGDVLVLDSTTMRVRRVVRKAHITVVTAMGFSETSRDLMSTSMDSSARVTVITEKKTSGFSMWIIFFIIILAVAVYFVKNNRMIPEETWSRISSHFQN
uniref:SEC12-like protein 2 n=1 Tax=Kalanchoe fedtschenkoi TaxID=63787 RepID=A0A7N0UAR8_KALFE